MLFLVEFFKILRDDGDGERHHQHARDGTKRPNQLPQSCKKIGLKGHCNEADFLEFWQKFVLHRSLNTTFQTVLIFVKPAL
jgi:hypothetical protein